MGDDDQLEVGLSSSVADDPARVSQDAGKAHIRWAHSASASAKALMFSWSRLVVGLYE